MDIKANYFYLIKASLNDSRIALNEKAAELEFELGDDVCQKCLTNLTNPRRRIYSEIRWFLDESEERIHQILEKIDSGEKIEEVESDLSIINLIDYWYHFDKNDISYQIANLSYFYNTIQSISCSDIVESINEHRRIAGFTEAVFSDVSAELSSYLSEVENKVLDSIFGFSERSQSDLVFRFAKSIASQNNPYPEWGFPQSILARYELLYGDKINNLESKIKKIVEEGMKTISFNSDKDIFFDEVDDWLRRWEEIANPISYINFTNGVHRRSSMEMLCSIRDCVLYLNNIRKDYTGAIDLNNILINHCKYFPTLSEDLKKGLSTIKKNNEIEVQNREYIRRAEKAQQTKNVSNVLISVLGIGFVFFLFVMCSI